LLAERLGKIENLVHLSTGAGGNTITEEAAEKALSQWFTEYIGGEDINMVLNLFRAIYSLEVKNWDEMSKLHK
jgi:hypothetical protein